ncbi:MAG: hypothetical protein R3B70_48045 [Polyangiaceae bacterium]
MADKRGFLHAVADGTVGANGSASGMPPTRAVDFYGTEVDDSSYLSGVVTEIQAKYSVDPKRIYFVGHSNGGFMSYRMACDHADQIAAIVSLAGATFSEDAKCAPSAPVAVLQIHGTADDTVLYDGGSFGPVSYPGALGTVEKWAANDGCEVTPQDGGALDLESGIPGDDSQAMVYSSGCKGGGHAELWTITGGGHIPALAADFGEQVFDFLEAHPKP